MTVIVAVLLIMAIVFGVLAYRRVSAGQGALFLAGPAVLAVVIALALGIFGASHSGRASAQPPADLHWLQPSANYTLVTTYTPQGQPQYLDAAVTPILFVSRQTSLSFIKSISKVYAKQGLIKKPLVIVITDPNTTSVKTADAEGARFAAKSGLSLSWFLQAGPADQYATATPSLVYLQANSQTPTVVSDATRITAALPKAVALPKPVVPGKSR